MVDPDSVGHTLFEKLTAGVTSDRDDVVVRHQYDYPLDTGGQKEVDVMVSDSSGTSEERIMIECKNYSSNVSQGVVDEMVGLLCQSDAGRGIIIARTGFQKGALERAEALQATDDMRVELYVLRFVGHEPEDRDPKRLKNVLMNIGFFPNMVIPLQTYAVPQDEEVLEGLDGLEHLGEGTLGELGDPQTEAGEPIGKTLEELLRDKHIERLHEESEYGVVERDGVPVTVGVEPGSVQEQHTADFEDVYFDSDAGLMKLENINYKVSAPWIPIGESDVPIGDLDTDIAEMILAGNDMVLIDALSDNSAYISSEDALNAFLDLPKSKSEIG